MIALVTNVNQSEKEVSALKMERMMIQLPAPLKRKLDALRAQGYTAAGYIRNVLEQHFSKAPTGRKGR